MAELVWWRPGDARKYHLFPAPDDEGNGLIRSVCRNWGALANALRQDGEAFTAGELSSDDCRACTKAASS